MESLIVWCPTTPLPGLARLSGAGIARALGDAFVDDVIATAALWRETRIAADFNRRLVVVAPAGEHARISARVDAAGGRLEAHRGDDPEALIHAFADEFERGARAVAVIGIEAPTVHAFHLDHAFRALQFERLVVGPSFNDGVWLVGCQRPAPAVVGRLVPGRPGVLRAHEAAMQQAGDAPHLLPFWYTVDDAVEHLAWHLRQTVTSDREPRCQRTREVLATLPGLTATTSRS